MTERIDYRHNAQERIKVALKDPKTDNALVTAQIAQAEATLALVDEVKHLRESFGQCDHGYTICPFCIRSAMEGLGR